MTESELARSFEIGGANYDAHRPGFPAEAATLLAPVPLKRALDVGAGTGKFTRLLVDRARTVVAVDPSASMLRELAKNLPSVDCRSGSAEDLPIEDEVFDLITVAQAFHWFDADAACAEFRRVLIPGGRLGLLWNTPDPTCVWDVEAYKIAHSGQASDADGDREGDSQSVGREPPRLPGFAFESQHVVPWQELISRADYMARWTTVSTYLAANESARSAMLTDIESMLDANPSIRGLETLTLPQRTEIFIYRRS
ncbi:class I SAM-dependent methyltransferase [Microcella sp.]|uniref:class I SAM-dependent methyltransferase n=1 Tax=Microcella sp. TaxID=1913979 RepID=UPI00391DA15B